CGDIERCDPSAHSHLTAARSDENFSFYDDRRHRDRLAFREVTHLRAPQLSSGLYIDSDGVTVEQVVEALGVGVCGAAIDYVAAGAANRLLRVLRPELPFQRLPWLLEIQRVRDVRIWRDDVHRVVDHERLPFVTAK